MKTLKTSWLAIRCCVFALMLFSFENSDAQCSVNALNVTRCAGQSYNIGIGATTSGTTGAVQYSWDGGPYASNANKTVAPSVTTNYTLTILDASGCTASDVMTVTVNPLPVVNAGPDVTICAGATAPLCATASSPNGSISIYSWVVLPSAMSGPSSACWNVTPTTNTTYSITVSDNVGCVKNDQVQVFVIPLPIVNAGPDQSMCLAQGSITLTGTPAGGTWSGAGVSPSGVYTATTTGTFPLTYSYTSPSPDNCPNTDQVMVTVTTPTPVNGGSDEEACLNEPAFQLPSVGTWSGSSSVSASGLFTPSVVGTHNLTVTAGAPGCATTDNVTVVVLPLPTVNAGSDVAICATQSVTLNGSASSVNGPITGDVWTGGFVDDPNILNPITTPSSTTTLTLTVTDSHTCQAMDQITITVNPNPTVNAGSDISVCSNAGPVNLTGFSPAGGTWSGTNVTPGGVFTPASVAAFTLTYSFTNGSNCTATDQRIVTVINAGTVNAGNDTTVCINSGALQLMSGGTWSGSPLVSASGLFAPVTAGNYTLTYSMVSGSCTITDQVVIHVLALPVVNAGSDVSACFGSVINLSGTANSVNGAIASYHWNSAAVSNQNISNPTLTASSSMPLILTATDAAGCTGTDQLSVTVNPLPTVNAGNDFTICNNAGSVALSGFSPAGGTWSGAGVTSSGTFTPTTTGIITLTYSFTNANNCTATDQVSITVIAPGTVNAGNDTTVCLNSGTFQLMTGGVWSGSPLVTAGGAFTPSSVGNYTLTYSATSGGCNATDQLVVHVLALPSVNAGSDISVCLNTVVPLSAVASSSNGAIASYHWNNASVSDQDIFNPTIIAGSSLTLNVLVQDIAGCIANDNLSIVVNPLPVVNAGNDVTFCDQPVGEQLSGFSPVGGTWSGPHVTGAGLFTPAGTGTFTLNYCFTNANGCIACDSIVVTVINSTPTDAGDDVEVCAGLPAFNLIPVTAGGTWTPGTFLTSAGVFNPSTAGAYICIYSVGSGSCLTSNHALVTVNALPVAHAGVDAAICAGDDYQLNGSATGGESPYDFLWDHASALDDDTLPDPMASVIGTTTFGLHVEDNNGCVANDAMLLTVVPLPMASFNSDTIGCVNASFHFDNTSTGAASYHWSFGNSNSSVSTDPNTTYLTEGIFNVTLIAYNSIGCGDTISQDVEIIGVPDAHFSLSSNEGCSPLNVAFTNESTGDYISSAWNLGGTANANDTPAAMNFSANLLSATYNISLTVSNTCGSDTYAEQVIVNPQPHAAFTTLASTQCSPSTVNFDNTSAGFPDSYHWDLGNGGTSDDAEPIAQVYLAGATSEDYSIWLFAYNECGADSIEHILTVQPNTVEINLVPSTLIGCSPLFVEFNNMTTGATNYHFDFDDSSSSNLMNPNHIFDDAGIYDVHLYADNGCSYDTTIVTIEVLQSPSVVISAAETAVCPMEAVHFSSTTTGSIDGIAWDFGDATYSNEEDPIHQYSAGDNYAISASVTESNGCPATASMNFLVHPKPNAAMTLSNVNGCSPLNVCTNNTTTGATVYHWDFGNTFTSASENECQEYINVSAAADTYLVMLDVENEFGCTNHAEESIIVQPQPVTSFVLSDTESCFLFEEINVTVTTEGSTSYQWQLNGVDYSTQMQPSFMFDSVGAYDISLISYNDLGCTDDYNALYTVHPTPQIDIMPDPFNGCAPLTVMFENQTSDGSTWSWSFGNGASSILEEPLIVFEDEGIYDVQLIATSQYGCQQVQFFDDMIEVFGLPVANFSFMPDAEIIYDLDVAFADSSIGAVSYLWDFGDGSVSDDASPVHHFIGGGMFDVKQTVTNEFGCTDEMVKPVNIDNSFYLFMPNSFTPDNDGINDLFIPVLSSEKDIKDYEFIVMNRWGEIIFKTDDPGLGWMGNSRGGEFYTHNDTFTWAVRISFTNKQLDKNYTGSVNVLR